MCIDIHAGSNGSSWANVSDDNPDVTNADLGLAEDHFSHPEVNIIYYTQKILFVSDAGFLDGKQIGDIGL